MPENSNTPRHRRIWTVPDECQIRANYDEPKIPKIVGYAAVFDTTVEIWAGYSERIAPGAFTKTIQDDDVRALINHDPNYVLGRNKSGTLKLSEDNVGLRYEITPPDTQVARDLMTLLKRKDISQSSFGFNIIGEKRDTSTKGKLVRTITEAKLFDVSPVTYPAYPTTQAEVRMTSNPHEILVDGEPFLIEVDEPKPKVPAGPSEDQIDAGWEAVREAAIKPRKQ